MYNAFRKGAASFAQGCRDYACRLDTMKYGMGALRKGLFGVSAFAAAKTADYGVQRLAMRHEQARHEAAKGAEQVLTEAMAEVEPQPQPEPVEAPTPEVSEVAQLRYELNASQQQVTDLENRMASVIEALGLAQVQDNDNLKSLLTPQPRVEKPSVNNQQKRLQPEECARKVLENAPVEGL